MTPRRPSIKMVPTSRTPVDEPGISLAPLCREWASVPGGRPLIQVGCRVFFVGFTMIETETRTCKKCGEVKAIDGFYPDRNYVRGDRSGRAVRLRCFTCKSCYNEINNRRSPETRDEINKKRRENRDKITEQDRRYRERNREKVRAWGRRQCRNRQKESPLDRKNGRLKGLFGITMDEYLDMLGRQGGVCAICSRAEKTIDKRNGRPKYLSVDHCHETGQIRMLLCWHCNTAIGKFNHDPALLRKAADYLERFMG